MASLNFEQVLDGYKAALDALSEQISSATILGALVARDNVESCCRMFIPHSPSDIRRLHKFDERLQSFANAISQETKVHIWRKSLNAPHEAWWWYLKPVESARNRLDWILGLLSAICLTFAFSLLLDIAPRFLSGGPDTWSAFAVLAQSVVAMLGAGGILTSRGREMLENLIVRSAIPRKFWQGVRLGLAILLLSTMLVVKLFLLDPIAIFYNNNGLQKAQQGQYSSAMSLLQRALKLNPDYPEAHYNLGLVYEDLQDQDKAREEYHLAVQGGLDAAYNNLARLYILKGDYALAVPLLLTGLDKVQDDEIRYDLFKNLGWARLEQLRYNDSITQLQAAIEINPDKAPAYCLLAQALDAKAKTSEALQVWENCLRLANEHNPDEDVWIGLARERLTER